MKSEYRVQMKIKCWSQVRRKCGNNEAEHEDKRIQTQIFNRSIYKAYSLNCESVSVSRMIQRHHFQHFLMVTFKINCVKMTNLTCELTCGITGPPVNHEGIKQQINTHHHHVTKHELFVLENPTLQFRNWKTHTHRVLSSSHDAVFFNILVQNEAH